LSLYLNFASNLACNEKRTATKEKNRNLLLSSGSSDAERPYMHSTTERWNESFHNESFHTG
jgi:hypothetical protein